jgi:hypothetical protein
MGFCTGTWRCLRLKRRVSTCRQQQAVTVSLRVCVCVCVCVCKGVGVSGGESVFISVHLRTTISLRKMQGIVNQYSETC